ncbi:dihydroxyacetone kinase phosphoryl donor subunit DhaM [Glaciibacter psychrotolerans]|uniref:Phosphocarrier protein HPr n=1 Tax=Glaciibacter psychrotolerans TaxID=670054 RepID=A0A7Z0ECW3_9MICO|nr:dihydroxyacetone kinase phosphoryl donor subunit DhaM [Leifsonia psychrotolerans]NYJ19290.1 PTS hybrid protein [Leifsonia psychrotolerans]
MTSATDADSKSGRVGLVFVSHSAQIADGLVELARQMAPQTTLVSAGGTADGELGTSFDRVLAAVSAADTGAGVVILGDLGSAYLTAETARDFLDPLLAARVVIVDAALVEGGVAAAVAAESGGDLEAVVAAARTASVSTPSSTEAPPSEQKVSRTVTLRNRDGLHARPAAEFVKLATTFTARVTVNGTDAKSLLGIMALGLTQGTQVELASADPGGTDAVTALAALIESGFGEA